MKLSEALDAAGKSIDINLPYTGMQMHNAADAAREMEQRLSDNDDAIGMLMQKIAALEQSQKVNEHQESVQWEAIYDLQAALEKAKEPENLKCSRSDCPGHADFLQISEAK